MTSSLPSYAAAPVPDPPRGGAVIDRMPGLLAAAHAVWASPEERRRMRAFGFRPAVESGVLKREWRGAAVRVSEACLRLRRPDGRLELHLEPGGVPTLLLDGAPLEPGDAEGPLVATALDLVGSYERWVEAREGRRERIDRALRTTDTDRRPVNALAETRRLQRLLQAPRGRGR